MKNRFWDNVNYFFPEIKIVMNFLPFEVTIDIRLSYLIQKFTLTHIQHCYKAVQLNHIYIFMRLHKHIVSLRVFVLNTIEFYVSISKASSTKNVVEFKVKQTQIRHIQCPSKQFELTLLQFIHIFYREIIAISHTARTANQK